MLHLQMACQRASGHCCLVPCLNGAECIQAQTAECIVLGEIATDRIVVVLSKIDLLPEAKQAQLIAKAQKIVRATFQATRFANCTILPASAKPGVRLRNLLTAPSCLHLLSLVRACFSLCQHMAACKDLGRCILFQLCNGPHLLCARVRVRACVRASVRVRACMRELLPCTFSFIILHMYLLMQSPSWCGLAVHARLLNSTSSAVWPGEGTDEVKGEGLEGIIAEIMRLAPSQPRQPDGPFLFAVDHCFAIKGQGTVLTGTVLQVLATLPLVYNICLLSPIPLSVVFLYSLPPTPVFTDSYCDQKVARDSRL